MEAKSCTYSQCGNGSAATQHSCSYCNDSLHNLCAREINGVAEVYICEKYKPGQPLAICTTPTPNDRKSNKVRVVDTPVSRIQNKIYKKLVIVQRKETKCAIKLN